MINIAFLCSGNGSTMQAVIDACKNEELAATPCIVITDNAEAQALERAKLEWIPFVHFGNGRYSDEDHLDAAICARLRQFQTDIVVLAGYLKRVGPRVLERYDGRIINIHPSLLPKYGGKGWYGRRVHEAVLASGDRETGVTVHFVDEGYDTGEIIAQGRVPVMEWDTVDDLEARVKAKGNEVLIEVLNEMAK